MKCTESYDLKILKKIIISHLQLNLKKKICFSILFVLKETINTCLRLKIVCRREFSYLLSFFLTNSGDYLDGT